MIILEISISCQKPTQTRLLHHPLNDSYSLIPTTLPTHVTPTNLSTFCISNIWNTIKWSRIHSSPNGNSIKTRQKSTQNWASSIIHWMTLTRSSLVDSLLRAYSTWNIDIVTASRCPLKGRGKEDSVSGRIRLLVSRTLSAVRQARDHAKWGE